MHDGAVGESQVSLRHFPAVAGLFFIAALGQLRADPPAAVQVDVSKLLNARVVTTFSDGKVVPLAGC